MHIQVPNIHTYEFHNLSWITEINEFVHDILIYWDAPVYANLHLELQWKRFELCWASGSWTLLTYLLIVRALSVTYMELVTRQIHTERSRGTGDIWKSAGIYINLTVNPCVSWKGK